MQLKCIKDLTGSYENTTKINSWGIDGFFLEDFMLEAAVVMTM